MRHEYREPGNQRLEAGEYEVAGRPVIFTVRSYRNQRPFVSASLARETVSCLLLIREACDCQVIVYCLMPDHLHVIASPARDGASVLTMMNRFKGLSTNRSWLHGWSGKLWQPRSFDHVIRSDESLQARVEYILDNPVRAGIVEERQEYAFAAIVDTQML